MPFQKGNIPWIKGRKLSKETRLKMSLAAKKRMQIPEIKKKATAHFIGNKYNVGRKLTEEHKKKMSESLKAVFAITKGASWKGGEYKNQQDYILVLRHDHPYSAKSGYIMKHRLVMEEYLDRYLSKEEVVHHKNGIVNDNRIENLELLTPSEHSRIHNKLRPQKAILL